MVHTAWNIVHPWYHSLRMGKSETAPDWESLVQHQPWPFSTRTGVLFFSSTPLRHSLTILHHVFCWPNQFEIAPGSLGSLVAEFESH